MTTDTDIQTRRTRGQSRWLTAVAGIGGLAAATGAAFAFPDPLGGAGSAAQAAERLAGSSVQLAVALLGGYLLLAGVVTVGLSGLLEDGPGARAIPVFGVLHLAFVMIGFAGLSGARAVGVEIFDGVSAAGLEAGLVMSNAATLVAQWTGAGMAGAVLFAALAAGRLRVLAVVGAVMGAGMLVPEIGWAILYLMPLWFAVAGVLVARQRT